MNDRLNQKKLVDAFKTFFQKSVNPYVSANEQVMKEWKYFSRLISTQPIDFNQIQFYLLLANKPQIMQGTQQDTRNTSLAQISKYTQSGNKLNDSDKKSNNSLQVGSPKKKSLVACLQSFQSLMIKNQQKLESICRKEIPSSPATAYPVLNSTTNTQPRRYY